MTTALAVHARGRSYTLPPFFAAAKTRWITAAVATAGLTVLGTVLFVLAHRAAADAAAPIENYSVLLADRRGLPMGLSLMPSPVGSRWEIPDQTRAVRLGARLADLEIVARARDGAAHAGYYDQDPVALWVIAQNSAFVAKFAGELAAGFDDAPGGRAAAGWYRAVQRRGQDRATINGAELLWAREWALDFKPGFLVLGEFLEIGRTAALRGDRAFFTRAKSRAIVDAAVKLPQLSPDARAALEQVQALTSGDIVGDFHAIEQSLTDALAALAK